MEYIHDAVRIRRRRWSPKNEAPPALDHLPAPLYADLSDLHVLPVCENARHELFATTNTGALTQFVDIIQNYISLFTIRKYRKTSATRCSISF